MEHDAKIRDGQDSIEKTDIEPKISMTINSFAMIMFGQEQTAAPAHRF